MNARTYPRTAWILQPSFKPKQVTVISSYSAWDSYSDWECIEDGPLTHIKAMRDTLEEIIAFGQQEIDRMQSAIDKRQTTLDKKRGKIQKARANESKP